jgi:hypothetical protein
VIKDPSRLSVPMNLKCPALVDHVLAAVISNVKTPDAV